MTIHINDIQNKLITTPGKFEGEMDYTKYFYEQSLDGTWEQDTLENGDNVVWATVTKEEGDHFIDIEEGDTVVLLEMDVGFVSLLAYKNENAAMKDLGLDK